MFPLFFSNMATLCIFNPEHDLCLANGDRNFVPPQSALAFAREGTVTMRLLYGDDVPVIAADDYELWRRSNAQPDAVVAWGWDMRLKQTLLRQGMSESLMPSDEAVAQIRRLQHRSFLAPLQPHASAATSVDQVAELLEFYMGDNTMERQNFIIDNLVIEEDLAEDTE